MAASVKVGFGHMSRILTAEPFLLIGISSNMARASCEREEGESSMTGISTRNLGCFIFLSLPASLGLLRGFCKVVNRHVLAWRTASSLEVGGEGEETLQWRDRGGILDVCRGFEWKV